jgi:hypothetical protein
MHLDSELRRGVGVCCFFLQLGDTGDTCAAAALRLPLLLLLQCMLAHQSGRDTVAACADLAASATGVLAVAVAVLRGYEAT